MAEGRRPGRAGAVPLLSGGGRRRRCPGQRRAGASSAPAGLKVRAAGLARHPAGAGARRDTELLPQQAPAPVPSVEPRWVVAEQGMAARSCLSEAGEESWVAVSWDLLTLQAGCFTNTLECA